MDISTPKFINEYALACLEALQHSGSGRFIVLGGAFGLAHYHEYRMTKDIDAWWTENAGEKEKEEVVRRLETTLAGFGDVQLRRFGDVVSVDLRKDNQVVFNFQIAARSALLRTPLESPWPPVALDAFEDLIASKMTALIERGAPRDFLDIYEVCKQKLVTVSQCWELWKEREKARGVESPDPGLGCEGLLLHLSRIERLRPLESIRDKNQRKHAEAVRNWFKYEFCKGKKPLDRRKPVSRSGSSGLPGQPER